MDRIIMLFHCLTLNERLIVRSEIIKVAKIT